MSYLDLGYNQFLDKSIAGNLEKVTDQDFDSVIDTIPGNKIGGGVSTSSNGVIEINWDEGFINVNFPPGGFLKLGYVGTDSDGNQAYGLLLNDGVTNRVFEGYQAQGF